MVIFLRVAAALRAVEGWLEAEFTSEFLREIEADFLGLRVRHRALVVDPQNSKVIMRFPAFNVLNQKPRAVFIAHLFEQCRNFALDHFRREDVTFAGSNRYMLNRLP